MLHRSPVGPERNGPPSLPSSRSRWMSLLRAECQAAKLSNFWVTREIIEEKERKTHRSRAQRHVCVLPPSTTSMCALSRMPAVPPLCFSKLPAPSLSLLSLPPPSRSAQRGFCHSGRSGSGPLSTPPRPTTTTTKKERGRDTYKSRRLRPTEQTLPSLSQCEQGVSTGELDFTVAHSAPSHDRTGPSCTSL